MVLDSMYRVSEGRIVKGERKDGLPTIDENVCFLVEVRVLNATLNDVPEEELGGYKLLLWQASI